MAERGEVPGQLPREETPVAGTDPGYVASHKNEDDGYYYRTSLRHPLPIQAVAMQAQLEEMKALIQATNERLDQELTVRGDMSLTGSYIEEIILSENASVTAGSIAYVPGLEVSKYKQIAIVAYADAPHSYDIFYYYTDSSVSRTTDNYRKNSTTRPNNTTPETPRGMRVEVAIDNKDMVNHNYKVMVLGYGGYV